MKIKVGKYYRTRDGRKVGPMEFDQNTNPKWPWRCPQDFVTYANDGTHLFWAKLTSKDLIAEWTDESESPSLSSASIDQIAIDSIKWHYNEGFDSDLEKEAFRIVLRHYGVSMP